MSQNKGIPIPSSGRIAIPGREGEFFEPRDLSTTPGGTIYGTTPGGTRIVYDRETLLALRNSPLAQTPPKNMAKIPGVTAPALDAPIPEDDPQSDDDDAPKGSEKNTTFEME